MPKVKRSILLQGSLLALALRPCSPTPDLDTHAPPAAKRFIFSRIFAPQVVRLGYTSTLLALVPHPCSRLPIFTHTPLRRQKGSFSPEGPRPCSDHAKKLACFGCVASRVQAAAACVTPLRFACIFDSKAHVDPDVRAVPGRALMLHERAVGDRVVELHLCRGGTADTGGTACAKEARVSATL